ncbi:MAG: hypothetical protein KGH61_00180 [Candidatus Micrarchaeota archaeon]|nr:hypothetical protein [Candidatus Micrarchaeota archaeon]MDE1847353.1 hypothetical protein [Candidatus Micrarchaeota archaeon]MDE1863968.1 hypothetical protein [Candidatus Micrarchaeota archaeon]
MVGSVIAYDKKFVIPERLQEGRLELLSKSNVQLRAMLIEKYPGYPKQVIANKLSRLRRALREENYQTLISPKNNAHASKGLSMPVSITRELRSVLRQFDLLEPYNPFFVNSIMVLELARDRPRSALELSDIMGISQPSVRRLIHSLKGENLIKVSGRINGNGKREQLFRSKPFMQSRRA